MILTTADKQKITELLLNDKIGILPTDTIYGVHCKANDENLVKKIYEIKDRPENMPLIIAAASEEDLDVFDLIITDFQREQIKKYWPGPNTLIFKTQKGETKAIRVPNNEFMQSILEKTGPLVSTSANLHGQPSATSVNQAINYFGDKIDFYVDGGDLNNPASSIYDITGSEVIKLR